MVVKQHQKQSVNVKINIGNRRKNKHTKKTKREPARASIPLGSLGGFVGLSRLPPNPFMESQVNMMASMQQNLSNNFKSSLSDIRTENTLMMDKYMEELRRKFELEKQPEPDKILLDEANKKIAKLQDDMQLSRQIEAKITETMTGLRSPFTKAIEVKQKQVYLDEPEEGSFRVEDATEATEEELAEAQQTDEELAKGAAQSSGYGRRERGTQPQPATGTSTRQQEKAIEQITDATTRLPAEKVRKVGEELLKKYSEIHARKKRTKET